jgi:hypothetical protein
MSYWQAATDAPDVSSTGELEVVLDACQRAASGGGVGGCLPALNAICIDGFKLLLTLAAR